VSYAFVKGHGTENDFVIVPAEVELTPGRVRALCDRRAGIGGDGVIRAVREDGRWFMDYRNCDGSPSEMCGNGIRLFARYLHDGEGEPFPMEIGTQGGIKTLTEDAGLVTVDMGTPRLLGKTEVAVDGRAWRATHVDLGNPHAVVFVDDLADAGPLLAPPAHDAGVFPEGVNVEFVARRGERHVAMRVHERGSGETRSCGTGAGAAMVATAAADGGGRGSSYAVEVPGGTLTVTWTDEDRVLLTGHAVIVARGTTDL
jgi:diaminopimelate epimerase